MHHDSLNFHNVVDLPPALGGGLHLARFPSAIWPLAETSAGSGTIRSSNACEIQFVSDKPSLRIYLRSLEGTADLIHLRGNQIVCYETLESGKTHCLNLTLPTMNPNCDPATRALGGYAPQVYRIVSVGATLAYHGIDPMGGNVRPPFSEETPALRYLAYGSSITQSGASFHNYVNSAANMLEASVLNLGMGGSCWIEPAIADFIAARDDWDLASFELGINMLNPSRDNMRFAEKVDYLLNTVTRAHPEKPLFLLTILGTGTYHEIDRSDRGRDLLEKNDILRSAAAKYPDQVTLLEGTDIITDFRGFQVDLLHPEPFAYVRMGLNLAEAISAKLST